MKFAVVKNSRATGGLKSSRLSKGFLFLWQHFFLVTNFRGKTKPLISRGHSYAKRLNKRSDNWSFERQFAYKTDKNAGKIGCTHHIYFPIFSIYINHSSKKLENWLFGFCYGERAPKSLWLWQPFKLNPETRKTYSSLLKSACYIKTFGALKISESPSYCHYTIALQLVPKA